VKSVAKAKAKAAIKAIEYKWPIYISKHQRNKNQELRKTIRKFLALKGQKT